MGGPKHEMGLAHLGGFASVVCSALVSSLMQSYGVGRNNPKETAVGVLQATDELLGRVAVEPSVSVQADSLLDFWGPECHNIGPWFARGLLAEASLSLTGSARQAGALPAGAVLRPGFALSDARVGRPNGT